MRALAQGRHFTFTLRLAGGGGGEVAERVVALALDRVARLADDVEIGRAALCNREIGGGSGGAADREEPAEHEAQREREKRDDDQLEHRGPT
ncbi:hypothetical protein [uncultured Sphingomonas sp.]|uniref:hypothetical protein n=1 Tax=uncultured Sphingomonas sp. TaxID=158754 RepID=UPI0035CC3EE0